MRVAECATSCFTPRFAQRFALVASRTLTPPLPPGAWLGLTATTGDLADNHDVSSLVIGLEDEVASDPKDETPRPVIVGSGSEEVDKAIRSAVAYETHILTERLAALEHRFEYE